MIQHEFEELLEQFSQDELNEKSTMKGQFTSYITRRMEWHAIRYAAKNINAWAWACSFWLHRTLPAGSSEKPPICCTGC